MPQQLPHICCALRFLYVATMHRSSPHMIALHSAQRPAHSAQCIVHCSDFHLIEKSRLHTFPAIV